MINDEIQTINHSSSGVMVRIVPLGSAGHVNRNMYAYEYWSDTQTLEDIMIMDCGVEFPDSEQLGVDLIIPDVSYLRDKLSKIRGIVITHAHEDHFGALPYVLKDIGKPTIYAAKLVIGFIQNKLRQFEGYGNQSYHEIVPETDTFALGHFTVTPFRVNHSVPDTAGMFIQTPVGNLVHAADFKFDWTPVDGKQFEISKLAQLSAQGVKLLASDSLGAEIEGFTHSERTIQKTFEQVMEEARGQVFITTISSNISRMQQAINASRKYGRHVVFAGRSIEQNVQVAHKLGYIDFPEEIIIDMPTARRMPNDRVTYIITGCYGQEGSGLDRVSRHEHREIEIQEEATVIFSADPIPGVYDVVGAMIDRLTLLGSTVVYSSIQDNLHVSGHGILGDLRLMVSLTKPEYFMPIGGDPRHQRAYSSMIEDMGHQREHVFEMHAGETLEVHPDIVQKGEMISVENIFVDGRIVGDVGNIVLRDRQILADDGIVVVILQKGPQGSVSSTVDLVSRGFIYMADSGELIKKAEQMVKKEIQGKQVKNWGSVKSNIEKRLGSFFYKQTGRNPMIVAFLTNPPAKVHKKGKSEQ